MTDHELQQALLERLSREPAAPEPRRLGLMDRLMYLVCFLLAGLLLWGFVLAPLAERVGLIVPISATQPPATTALPTLPPRPTTPPYQAPPAAAPQEAAPVIAPAPVIVVTPTYSTGCHDGVSYVDGVPVNGTCAGAAFAPELPTETAAPTPTIAPATAVPPDPTYMDALQKQAPHNIRGGKQP